MKKRKRPSQKKRTMRLHTKCPNCLCPTVIYKTEWKSPTLTQLSHVCTNDLCHIRFLSYLEANRILQMPHAIVNPTLKKDMKLSKVLQDKEKQDIINQMEISDDDSDLQIIVDATALQIIDKTVPKEEEQIDLFIQLEGINGSS